MTKKVVTIWGNIRAHPRSENPGYAYVLPSGCATEAAAMLDIFVVVVLVELELGLTSSLFRPPAAQRRRQRRRIYLANQSVETRASPVPLSARAQRVSDVCGRTSQSTKRRSGRASATWWFAMPRSVLYDGRGSVGKTMEMAGEVLVVSLIRAVKHSVLESWSGWFGSFGLCFKGDD